MGVFVEKWGFGGKIGVLLKMGFSWDFGQEIGEK